MPPLFRTLFTKKRCRQVTIASPVCLICSICNITLVFVNVKYISDFFIVKLRQKDHTGRQPANILNSVCRLAPGLLYSAKGDNSRRMKYPLS